jgi:hypothetical protein
METKKLSNPVIDFFRNDIVWLVFYLSFAATVVERSITWLFFSDFAGGTTLRVVLGLWSTGLILGILFSVWLWLAIAGNTFRTVMGKLMICLLMLGLLCNWVLLYAVAYAYLGLIDGERLVREPITRLYFSIRHYVHRFAPVVARSIPLTLLSSASDLQFHDRQA